MARFAQAEREALAATLEAAGPDAPTLCAGWKTRDLAAHLVVRSARPVAALGIVLPTLRKRTDRTQAMLAAHSWADLTHRVQYPPGWMPLMWGPWDDAANLAEYFVHHEDVLRAQTGWTHPRALEPGYEDALWRVVVRSGRLLLRRSPVAVTLHTPDGRVARGRPGRRLGVTLTGQPAELLLYAYGRTDHAMVDIDGDAGEVEAFRQVRLGL